MGGRFKKEATLPQSKGLRLPRDLETMVETLATAGQTTRSEVLRELVVEALGGRADAGSQMERVRRGLEAHQLVLSAKMQALSTIEQEAVVRVERQVTQLGDNLAQRLTGLEETVRQLKANQIEITLVVGDLATKIPSQYNRLEGVLRGLAKILESQPWPAQVMQRLDEIQSTCEGVHDQLATLASGGADGR